MNKSFTIFSDGGSNGRGRSAAATIIDIGSKKRIQIVCDLGEATNNEAEIFSGILGFYLLSTLEDTKNYYLSANIHWISDSQYALNSASQYISNWQRNGWKTSQKEPVKNQGLWKLFLGITTQIEFTTEHVKGHSGHYENELCDQAVGWVREGGANISKVGWTIIDCRELIKELRLLDSVPDRRLIDELLIEILHSVIESSSPKSKSSNLINKSEDLITSSSISHEVIETTSKYFIELKKIDNIKDFLNESPELKKALTSLKSWMKKRL